MEGCVADIITHEIRLSRWADFIAFSVNRTCAAKNHQQIFNTVFNYNTFAVHLHMFNLIANNVNETRSGEYASVQIAKMGIIDASASNFALPNGASFNIKNENATPIALAVRLAGMPQGEFITTTFDAGWNPEIVVEIKVTTHPHNLKWGF